MNVNKGFSSAECQDKRAGELGERVLRDMKESREQEECLCEIQQQLRLLTQRQHPDVSSKRLCFNQTRGTHTLSHTKHLHCKHEMNVILKAYIHWVQLKTKCTYSFFFLFFFLYNLGHVIMHLALIYRSVLSRHVLPLSGNTGKVKALINTRSYTAMGNAF